jgi:DNA-binding transcriptional ArsR family regulator
LKGRVKELDDLALGRLEQVFSGLADKTRLRVLKLIAEEELYACEAWLHWT